MSKKDSVRAALGMISRDLPTASHPSPTATQGSLADRYVRHHTPEEEGNDEDAEADS